MEQIIKIAGFILESFIHIWPYLLVTIPLAVIVRQTGAANLIHKALSKNPLVSIFLATLVGAFSPFCSCSVIPVISSLLIGGVPLAPVMSFWIASPSMDPEIFFLSTAAIGWELSVWRLAATFIVSLSAGYATHIMIRYGILDARNILRTTNVHRSAGNWKLEIWKYFIRLKDRSSIILKAKKLQVQLSGLLSSNKSEVAVYCCIADEQLNSCHCTEITEMPLNHQNTNLHKKIDFKQSALVGLDDFVLWWQKNNSKKLWKETWEASSMVLKFMGIAFFISALITFYIPQDFLAGILKGNGSVSVVVATLAGIPAYTTNITALPLISGLLKLGMNPGAALAFLIAGPVTTLPAMVAVWGIATRKVFFLYLSFSVLGALLTGLFFNLVHLINMAPIHQFIDLIKIISHI